jgi:pyrimidine deaminase RibD-like protein
MSGDTDSAREVAKTHFRATLIAALIGCVGVIVAAWVGAAVGRTRGRNEAERTVTQQDVEIAQRDKQIAKLQAEVQQLRNQLQTAGGVPTTTGNTDDAGGWRNPQHNEELTFTLKNCSRNGQTVNCSFTLVADQRDYQVYLWGSSRLVNKEGTQRLASAISIAGRNTRVDQYTSVSENLVRGIPVTGSVAFEGVTTANDAAPLIELVVSGGNIQFRNVPFS